MSGDQSEEAAATAMGSRAPSTDSPSTSSAPAQSSPSGSPYLGSISNPLKTLVLTVNTGGDVYAQVLKCQQDNRGVCILSANGAISAVKLTPPAMHGYFRGSRLEILTLSGFFLPPDGGNVGAVGGITALLIHDSEGGIIGGVVDRLLTAASPVQLILGTFEVAAKKMEWNSSPNNKGSSSSGAGASSSTSQGSGRPV